jgi:hypothetical protein
MIGLLLLDEDLIPLNFDRDDMVTVLFEPLVEPDCLTGRGNMIQLAITRKQETGLRWRLRPVH